MKYVYAASALALAFGQCAFAADETVQDGVIPSQGATVTATPASPTVENKPGKELSEVVITATRTAKVVSEAPATVTVVTAKEIEHKSAQRVEEALAGAPGVFIKGLGAEQPSNYQNQITLRGIPGYYRTGVLVDGVAINNAFSGGVNMSLVPVDDIKQIEVVPGPFSSLYGGSGMAGVINIITKSPEKREMLAKLEGGSNNFRSVDLGYRNKVSETVGVSFSAGRKQSDGYVDTYVTKTPTATPTTGTLVTGWQPTTTNTGSATYIVGDKGRSSWNQNRAAAKVYLDIAANSRLILETSYLTHKAGDHMGNSYLSNGSSTVSSGSVVINGRQTSLNATDFLATTTGEDLVRDSVVYETLLADRFKLKTNLGYQKNHYWYTSITSSQTNTSGAGTLSDIPNFMYDGDAQLGFAAGESQYLITGVSFNASTLHKRVNALANWRDTGNPGALSDWSDGYTHAVAAYVQDEVAVSDKLTAYGGVRYDRWTTNGRIYLAGKGLSNYDTRTNSSVNPKVSLVYKLGQGSVIKGAIGKAFRAPNLSDMYSSFGTTTVYWSNPDLKPEEVTTAELGAEHDFGNGATVRGTIYRSNFSNLIYTATPVSNNSYKYNAGKAEANGVDLEVRQKLQDALTVFANFTAVNTRITENTVKPASVGKQVPLQPSRMANIGLEGSHGDWSGSIIGTYVGKAYSTDDNTDTVNNVYGSHDPYFITGAKVAYRMGGALSISLSVNNLGDRKFFQGTAIAPGRTAYFGLTYRN